VFFFTHSSRIAVWSLLHVPLSWAAKKPVLRLHSNALLYPNLCACRCTLTALASLADILLLIAAAIQAAPVQAEDMSIAFPASADPDIRQAQQTMVESWAYVQVRSCLQLLITFEIQLHLSLTASLTLRGRPQSVGQFGKCMVTAHSSNSALMGLVTPTHCIVCLLLRSAFLVPPLCHGM
jgi:hypothetical protein